MTRDEKGPAALCRDRRDRATDRCGCLIVVDQPVVASVSRRLVSPAHIDDGDHPSRHRLLVDRVYYDTVDTSDVRDEIGEHVCVQPERDGEYQRRRESVYDADRDAGEYGVAQQSM